MESIVTNLLLRFATKFHDKFSRSWINSTGQLFEWNRNGAIRSRFVSPIIKRRVKVGKFTKFCRPWKMNPSPEGITNGRHIYRREICQRRSFRQFWLILRDCVTRVAIWNRLPIEQRGKHVAQISNDSSSTRFVFRFSRVENKSL